MVKTSLPGRRPNTVMYPWEKNILPECFRGRPGIVLEKCIACQKCVKLCPTTCITMVQIEHETLGKVKRPQVNLGRCMMCGYCAEVLSLIHISEPTRRTPISYAVFCLKNKKTT